MTGISMPAVPVAVPVTPAGATATVGDAGAESGEFASLMAGLLGEDAPAADPAVDPAAPVDPALVDPALVVASGAPVATPAPAAPAVPGTVDTKDPKTPTTPLPTPGPIERTGPAGPGSRPVDDGGEVPRAYGCTTGVVVKGPRTPALPTVPGTPAQPTPVVDTPRQPPVAGPAGATPLPAAPATTDPAAAADTAVPGAAPATLPAADPMAGTTPAASLPVVPPTGAQVQPTAPIVAAGPSAPVHGGPSHIPDQVTAQVFPEINRLAVRAGSAGDGIHRITLNLHPETLGDVRVTLVVRGGEMKISIHAANEAGRIMADSIPELRRLLGSAGADAIVAVRDTGAGGATLNTADQGSSRSDLDRSGYDAHQQGRDTHGRDARTRDGHIATDGSSSGARGIAPGPPDQVRAIRSAGVDVTV